MNVTLERHSRGWWFGFDKAQPGGAKGWLPDICFSVWVIKRPFAVDASLVERHEYLNLRIGDEVVVHDTWDEGPWSGWSRGTTRSLIGSTTGLFLLSHAEQHVIVPRSSSAVQIIEL